MTQPQLLQMNLNPADVVYTPDDVARDVVNFFKPTGRILEPSCGEGAFLKYLPPDTEWCEIERGRDFFAEHRHFDWIVGNPPFSIFTDWLTHSFELADNVVYVMMPHTLFNSVGRLKKIDEFGGIKAMRIYGTGSQVKLFDGGFLVGAICFQRGYKGGTFITFRDALGESSI
jgi:hypothetical protein